MTTALDIPPGVVTGDNLRKLFGHARENGYAIPAFHCTSSSTSIAVLEAAKKRKTPVVITIVPSPLPASNDDYNDTNEAASPDPTVTIENAVAMALQVRIVAPHYRIPVVLHSEYNQCCTESCCSTKGYGPGLLEGLLAANKSFFDLFGEPLYSSHMLNFSQELFVDNLAICCQYFERYFLPTNLWLEIQIQDDGDEDRETTALAKTTTAPSSAQKTIGIAYEALSEFGDMFSIATTARVAAGIGVQLDHFGHRQNHGSSSGSVFLVLRGAGAGNASHCCCLDCYFTTDNKEITTTAIQRGGVVKVNLSENCCNLSRCSVGNPQGGVADSTDSSSKKVESQAEVYRIPSHRLIRQAEEGMMKHCFSAFSMLDASLLKPMGYYETSETTTFINESRNLPFVTSFGHPSKKKKTHGEGSFLGLIVEAARKFLWPRAEHPHCRP